MAEGKKSFVLYCDLLHTIEQLDDQKAGQVFKHILNYVNDKNPKSEDLILNLVFEPIKQQLKRDLLKFENSIQAKQKNGIIGNLKRWHTDIYNEFEKGNISFEKAVEIAESRKTSLPDPPRSLPIANDRNESLSVANIAVSVNDNVNDSVSVSVNVNDTVNEIKEKDKKENSSEFPFSVSFDQGNDLDYNPQPEIQKAKKSKKSKKTKELAVKFLEVQLPWDSEIFKDAWEKWKHYKKVEWNFSFRSDVSEGAAVKKLSKLAKNIELDAIEIIENSISSRWAGFYELKKENNGNGANNTGLAGSQQGGVNKNSFEYKQQQYINELVRDGICSPPDEIPNQPIEDIGYTDVTVSGVE